ncbi:MAG: asparagine synthase-related protein, partial [Euryarchaeota archaeon]
RELNELWVASHLTGSYDDREITAYEGIKRLPAAHFIVMKQEGAYVHQYWFLDPTREIHLDSNEEYAAAFREIFTEAVRCRLRSAFPVGAEVSGGLDSSSVACVARQQLEKQGAPPLLTFSLVFDESPESDESAYARALVAQGGVNPRWIPTGALSPLDVGLHRIFWQDDEPVWAPNIYLTCATMSAAQHAGVRVLLTGLDGDTTVYHGPEYLTELAVTGRWKTLAKNIYGFSKLGDHLSPWKVFWRRVLVPLTPDPIGQLWRLMRRRKQSTPVREDGIKPEFAQRVGFAALTDARQRDRQKPAKTVKQGHYDKLNAGVIQFALEEESRVAGAIGLEERHPFFDKRLIEFCLALPAEQKMYDGWTCIVLRRAMQELLPRKIQWRVSKSNLGPGHVRNLLVNDRALIEGVLADPPQRLEQYIDVPRLRQTFQRYAACPTAPDAMTLWNAVSLALWLPRVGFDNAI